MSCFVTVGLRDDHESDREGTIRDHEPDLEGTDLSPGKIPFTVEP
jgi:hypothetical protein